MNLLIDWGNTQLKAILVEELCSFIRQADELKSKSVESPEALLKWLSQQPMPKGLQSVLIASVRKDQETSKLVKLLSKYHQNCSIAKTSKFSAGVTCGYQDPSKLGIDRWLGIIGGYTKHQASVVIDIGSAVTLDLVNSEGTHLGGHIIPGVRLIKSSLTQTGKVIAEPRFELQTQFQLGLTTGECVEFGIQQLIEGYLKSVTTELASRFKIDNWIFTGGGGQFWQESLQTTLPFLNEKNSQFQPNIVFAGLVIDFLEMA